MSAVEPAKEGVPDGDRAEAAELQQVAGAAVATALLCMDCGVHREGARFICVLMAWAAGVYGDSGPNKCSEAPRSEDHNWQCRCCHAGLCWALGRTSSACWLAWQVHRHAVDTSVLPGSAGTLAAAGAEPTAEQIEAFKELQAEQERMRREYAQMQVSLSGAGLTKLCCNACWGGWVVRLAISAIKQ